MENNKKQDMYLMILLDIFICCILIIPHIYWNILNVYPENIEKGLYIYLLALIVGLPYYAKNACYTFKGINFLVDNIGLPRKSWTLLIYTFFFILGGTIKMFQI